MTNTTTPGTITIGGDLTVGRIGYGAMQLTGEHIWGPFEDHDAGVALLRGVVDAGITLIDTADVYGPHSNELLIRDALHPYPDGLAIATKGGFVRGGWGFDTLSAVGNPQYLRQSAVMSSRRLGVATIDLYYLHSGRATDASFEDQVGVLAELRREGLIRHIGLSNVTLEQLLTAQSIAPISALTLLHNLTVRVDPEILAAVEQDGIAFAPWHPVTITDGPLAPRAAHIVPRIAAAHDATVQQVAIAWQLRHSPMTMPIPGTRSLPHALENLAGGSLDLTDDEIAALDGLAA